MMPLALDLISTLVIGSTLPVATTDLTIVPRSAVATCDGSTSDAAPLSVANPAAPATTSTAMPPPMYSPLRDFLAELIIGPDENQAGEVHWPTDTLRYPGMWIL